LQRNTPEEMMGTESTLHRVMVRGGRQVDLDPRPWERKESINMWTFRNKYEVKMYMSPPERLCHIISGEGSLIL